jgi:hypothetical protein
VATSLQQLLDALRGNVSESRTAAALPDLTRAIGHLGRAFQRLAEDGVTATDSDQQRAVYAASRSCLAVGRLWQERGGPLSDLAGVAADLAGRESRVCGRAERWAIAVEVGEAADACAGRAQELLPHANVRQLTALREVMLLIERQALTEPPTADSAVVLDRLVPMPFGHRLDHQSSALEASVALAHAVARAATDSRLTIREFRAAVAACEVAARYAVVAADALHEPVVAAAPTAWQLVGRLSMTFSEGRGTSAASSGRVIPAAQTLVLSLRGDLGPASALSALPPEDRRHVAAAVRDVTAQLPELGDRLAGVAARWARTGTLLSRARDLPQAVDMPLSRLPDVLSDRSVSAHDEDFALLRLSLNRATELSRALADAVHGEASGSPPLRPHVLDGQHQRITAPGAAERLLSHAKAVTLLDPLVRGRQAPGHDHHRP